MEWPLDVPVELSYITSVKSPEELLKLLITHSDEHVIRFFEWIGSDELWLTKNMKCPSIVYQWISQEFIADRISHELVERVVNTVKAHYGSLKEAIYNDFILKTMDGQFVNVSSLLYGFQSSFLLSYFRQAYAKGEKKISLSVNDSSFILIHEYMTSGQILKLAESEETQIIDVMQKAEQWSIFPLATLCVKILKRYFSEDNIAQMLITAQKKGLVMLKEACFIWIENLKIGLSFSMMERMDLFVTIHFLVEKGEFLLKRIAPFVTGLGCFQDMPKESGLAEIISICKQLKIIDLSQSVGIHPVVLEAISETNIETLKLINCLWLNRSNFIRLTNGLKQLNHLNLADNEQLEFEVFNLIPRFKNLMFLNLSNCHGLDDGLFEGIALGCPRLAEFSLTDDQLITDEGCLFFVMQCPDLTLLDLSECHRITENGFIEIAVKCPSLLSLSVRRCRGITDHSIIQITRLCPKLRSLDISNCKISSPKTIEKLRENLPYLNIIF